METLISRAGRSNGEFVRIIPTSTFPIQVTFFTSEFVQNARKKRAGIPGIPFNRLTFFFSGKS